MSSEWYETFINDLDTESCMLVVQTYFRSPMSGSVSSMVYTVENNEYTSYSGFNIPINGQTVQQKYGDIFRTMVKPSGVHIYRYENNRFVGHECLTSYEPALYNGFLMFAALFKEYGLVPADEKAKAALQRNLKNSEKLANSLVYACYINDTQLIVERAAKASKTQLNTVMDYAFKTPLGFCALNDNLAGFKAVVESGADIGKGIGHGVSTSLELAVQYSPDIAAYIRDNFPEQVEKELPKLKKYGYNVDILLK